MRRGFYMTTPAFEQFAKDLLVFGTNQIEFAHIDYTRGDQHKLVEWSAILDKYVRSRCSARRSPPPTTRPPPSRCLRI